MGEYSGIKTSDALRLNFGEHSTIQKAERGAERVPE